MAKYQIASEEGAQRYGAEIGETVDLKLDKGEETAVIAAGWIEPETTSSKSSGSKDK